jgi:two-component system sensor histidine kinase/response regulator
MLAEDNALNQIVGRSVLEQMGLDVTLVFDGAEAVELIASQPIGHFGAVLMDMHMPVMDGLEATRRLRDMPQGKYLPIIAVTAAALSEDREQCLAAGMNHHIAKPLVPEQLMSALLKIVDLNGAMRERPVDPAPVLAEGVPKVSGFDLQPLYERLQRNERMVWQLLEEFVAREGVTAGELARLMSEQRLDEARLRTHALLGSAATLGATLVARTAAGLEAALGQGLASPAMLQSVSDALTSSLAAVNGALERRVN